mmetsp:Transcript_70404/g.139677  ORF Transcript_70404/g.139677 Transcript_70404/m.139677 type:complete len:176 (+) Transcript_70404:212-739(+)
MQQQTQQQAQQQWFLGQPHNCLRTRCTLDRARRAAQPERGNTLTLCRSGPSATAISPTVAAGDCCTFYMRVLLSEQRQSRLCHVPSRQVSLKVMYALIRDDWYATGTGLQVLAEEGGVAVKFSVDRQSGELRCRDEAVPLPSDADDGGDAVLLLELGIFSDDVQSAMLVFDEPSD